MGHDTDSIHATGPDATAIKAGEGASVSTQAQRVRLDQSGAQTGDQTYGHIAGGDINDPGPWLRYLWDLDQARTRRDDELLHEIREGKRAMARLSDEFELYQATIGSRLAALAAEQRTDRLLAVAALVLAVLALAVGLFL